MYLTSRSRLPRGLELHEDGGTFTPPSSMEVSYIRGTITPLEGRYPQRCPIHGQPLELGAVPISFGLPSMSSHRVSDGLPLVVNGSTLLLLKPRSSSTIPRSLKPRTSGCLQAEVPLALRAVWGAA